MQIDDKCMLLTQIIGEKKRVKIMDPQGYVLQTILKQSFFGYFEGD